MKSAKKMIALILCLLVLCSSVMIYAFAETASVQNTNITLNSCQLSISGINSNMSATMKTNTSMSLSIKMELQKLKSGTYTTIETWNASKTGASLSMSETRLINVLSTYRLKVTFKAGSETLVRYAYP